ncbi:MAG: acetyltransferase [Lentisphaeria bacterium]|nr:acetyltransferase [Lentisphaeria bacterium]
MNHVILLGAGPYAEEIGAIIDEEEKLILNGFIQDTNAKIDHEILSKKIYFIDNTEEILSKNLFLSAIGSPKRKNLIQQIIAKGGSFTSHIHSTAIVPQTVELGIDVVIGVRSVIANFTSIANHVLVNRCVTIGHHTNISSYVTVSPGANIAGCVSIGEGSYIGMGAVIIDGVNIGKNAIVGAGAVVTRDVPDGLTVVGVPAKPK